MKSNKTIKKRTFVIAIILVFIAGFSISEILDSLVTKEIDFIMGMIDIETDIGFYTYLLTIIETNDLEAVRESIEKMINVQIGIAISWDHTFFDYGRKERIDRFIDTAKVYFKDSSDVVTYSNKKIWDLNTNEMINYVK